MNNKGIILKKINVSCIVSELVDGWLFGIYGISTFVAYLMPNF